MIGSGIVVLPLILPDYKKKTLLKYTPILERSKYGHFFYLTT